MPEIILTAKYQFDPPNKTNKHEAQSEWKTTAFVTLEGSEMHRYYAWFIKRRFNLELNKPIRDPHISVINDRLTEEQKLIYAELKKEYDGKEVEMSFDPDQVRSNSKHWWIKCKCEEAEKLRIKIGLSPQPYMPFHVTIGHVNHLNLFHSEYIRNTILFHNL